MLRWPAEQSKRRSLSSFSTYPYVTYCKLKLAFEVWSGAFNMSWGSTCSNFKRWLAVVIKCLSRLSTLTVIVWFFVLSIWWAKRQVLVSLLSLSAQVKNSFLVVRIACFNLFLYMLSNQRFSGFGVKMPFTITFRFELLNIKSF